MASEKFSLKSVIFSENGDFEHRVQLRWGFIETAHFFEICQTASGGLETFRIVWDDRSIGGVVFCSLDAVVLLILPLAYCSCCSS